MAGDFYVAVQQNTNDGRRYQDDIQLTVAVTGERAGAPAYRGPDPTEATPTPVPQAGTPTPDGRPGWLVPTAAVTGLATVAALAALVVALLRVYRKSHSDGRSW
jgi:hypothetical protein